MYLLGCWCLHSCCKGITMNMPCQYRWAEIVAGSTFKHQLTVTATQLPGSSLLNPMHLAGMRCCKSRVQRCSL